MAIAQPWSRRGGIVLSLGAEVPLYPATAPCPSAAGGVAGTGMGKGSGEQGKKERRPMRSQMVVATVGSSSRMIIGLWLWMMARISRGEE